ncbi:MAG: transcription elongation factor GreB [Succinivibrio sp.]|nr:transcription elongation factor GreB [Succinivibrio sp.]
MSKGKPYITPEGYETLQKELNFLWNEKRPEVTAKVAWAASLGDRSENADYHYNKKLLRKIDSRIHALRHRLEELQVIRFNPQQEGRVYFGAYTEIEAEDDGTVMQLRLVGGDELFGRENCISIDSPMARALLGKAVDEEAVVQLPGNKTRTWYINKISYRKPDWYTEQEIAPFQMDEEHLDDAPAQELSAQEQEQIEQEYLAARFKLDEEREQKRREAQRRVRR